MSDIESDEEVITDIPEPKTQKDKPIKKPMSAERLEMLARAREKALAVRKANAEARGKKPLREAAKQKAKQNQEIADSKFREAVNKKVEEELAKRIDDLNTNKINEILEEKLKDIKPKKPRKKVIYEDTETESEAEVVKVVRKKKHVPAPVPAPAPAPVPEQPTEVPRQTHQFNQFTNLLRSIPRANRNPYYN